MKKIVIILTLCIMASITSFGQTKEDNINYSEEYNQVTEFFLKVGAPWEVGLENDEGYEWRCTVKPMKGFPLVGQYSQHEPNEVVDNGTWEEVKYGRENVLIWFKFVAKKVGKYRLTFENGIKRHIHEVNVLTEKKFNAKMKVKKVDLDKNN